MSSTNFMSNSYSEISLNGNKDIQSTQIVIKDNLGKIYMRDNKKETERNLTSNEIEAVLNGKSLKLIEKIKKTKKIKKNEKIKKNKKTTKKKNNNIRKHKGIIQLGGNSGKLKKGYKYSGKKLKNGLPEIVAVGRKSKFFSTFSFLYE